MEKSIIKIVNMSFKYNKEDYLFRNFNLDIKEGSFTTIIGKNGSGKSTLAKILIGLYKAEGYITIDGYLLNDFYIKKIRRIFSACFDNADNHFIGETVKDDLAFTLENLGYSKKEMISSINTIAKKFKLENILEESPEKLNNSEKEKVMIASSLIHKPQILLLDESIYKLNSSDKKLVFKILKEYQKEYKLTIILITHDLEDTLISDNIIYKFAFKLFETTAPNVSLSPISISLVEMVSFSLMMGIQEYFNNFSIVLIQFSLRCSMSSFVNNTCPTV